MSGARIQLFTNMNNDSIGKQTRLAETVKFQTEFHWLGEGQKA